jgi:hypothetical protein
MCQVPNCADIKCSFAHADTDVRGDIHKGFDVGLILILIDQSYFTSELLVFYFLVLFSL